jgi:hypothetical protein
MYSFLAATTFITGFLLAASDGPLFPWLNLAGVGVFAMTAPLAQRIRG